MEIEVNVKTYTDLVTAIRKEIENSKVFLEKEVNTRKTTVMWRIGNYIHTHILAHSDKADYGKYVFDKLSKELGIGKRTLYRAVQFYKEYQNSVSPVTQLPWTHYIILLTVENKVKRDEYEKIALKENLSKRQLEVLVRKDQNNLPDKTENELIVKRGRPGIHIIRELDGRLFVDCGFYTYIEKPELSEIKKPGTYIEYNGSDSYKIIEPDKSLLYTFKAKILEVIDADTVKALLDLGFGIKQIHTLRLRGINAESLQTESGAIAKKFVESKIMKLPFVVIKTYSRDIYLRYLADFFYLDGSDDVYEFAEKGDYLNQELMDEGLAERYVRW